MITRESKHIEVGGRFGTWQVVDDGWFVLTPDTGQGPETYYEHCFLLEYEEYVDDAEGIIVNQQGTIIMDGVNNGFQDMEEAGWAKMV